MSTNISIRASFSLLILLVLTLSPAYSQSTDRGSRQPNALERIRDTGVLVVGIDIPYGVMEFYDVNGKAAGIDIDIAKQFARSLGVELKIKTMPFDSLFKAIKENSVDIVASAVTITAKRQKNLLFSVPYLDAGMSLAVREDNDTIKTHANLAGKKVGVLKGTVGEDLAKKSALFRQSIVSSYEKNEHRMRDLQDAVIDAAIVHFLVTEEKTIKLVGDPLSQSFYGIVTNLDNTQLMAELNKILRDMKRNGTLISIRKKYTDIKQ